MAIMLTIVFLALPSSAMGQKHEVFVSPSGDDLATGTITGPKRTVSAAIESIRKLRDEGRIDDKTSVTIWLRGGRYPIESTVKLSSADSGSAGHPMLISSMEGETAVLDGRLPIKRSLFRMVSDPKDLSRLSPRGRKKIAVAKIPEGSLDKLLSDSDTQISFGSRMLQVARFPDRGFVIVDKFLQKDTGGQKEGTAGKPVGAQIGFSPPIPKQWAGEVNRNPKSRLTGYISASWLKQSFVIHSMSAQDGSIRLRDSSSYGLPNKKHLCRAYIEHLLPALDRPGEWCYDPISKQLFVWGPEKLNPKETLGVWAGPSAFELNDASNIRIQRLIIENCGGQPNGAGGITIKDGSYNRIAGCTFRNFSGSMTAFNLVGGTNNQAVSCDVYDVNNASRLNGGSYGPDHVTHGNNVIENCHFTQVYSTDFYGKVCGIGGAGNQFRNNLVHNHNGQIVTISGVENEVAKNEVFNTGIEEGDGGAFYQGAMLHSWHNRFRHNFFHHIMCVPEVFSRAAIFSDDGDSGDLVEGNVFFKAGEGFKTNTGMGHIAKDNLTIGGIHAIQILHGRAKERYERSARIIDADPASKEKDNLFGKTLMAFGKDEWKTKSNSGNWTDFVSPFFKKRYPEFDRITQQWQREKQMLSLNEISNNHAFGYGDRDPHAVPDFTTRSGNTKSESLAVFQSPKRLDFSYRGQTPKGAPEIPFDEIGLYLDEYRDRVPNKEIYRTKVYRYWEGQRSAAPRQYIPEEVNQRSYFNTGLLLKDYLR